MVACVRICPEFFLTTSPALSAPVLLPMWLWDAIKDLSNPPLLLSSQSTKKKKNKKIKQQAWKSVETVVLSSTQIRCEALTSFHICWLCGNVRTQDTSLIWIRVRNHLNWHFESFESQCYLINIVLPTATTCKYSSFYSFAVYEKLQQNVDLVPVPKLVISKQLQDHTGGTRCVHS